MPSYLVETFLARGAAGERQARDLRSSAAAEAMTREGARVRFTGSIHVPEDEICFFTFEAPSGREAARAAHRAGLRPFRIVEARLTPGPRETTPPRHPSLKGAPDAT